MLFAVLVITLAVFTSLTLPSAAVQELLVRLPDGTYEVVTDVPEGAELIGPAPEDGTPLPDLKAPTDAAGDPPADPHAPPNTTPADPDAPANPPPAAPAPGSPATPAPAQPTTPPAIPEPAAAAQPRPVTL